MQVGDGLLLLLAQVDQLPLGLGQGQKRRLADIVVGPRHGDVLFGCGDDPVRIEFRGLFALEHLLVGRLNFVLDVEHALVVFGPSLIQPEHGLAHGRVELAAIDWQVDVDADLSLQGRELARRLPELVEPAEDVDVGAILLAGEGDSGLLGVDARPESGQIGPALQSDLLQNLG